MIEGRFRFDNFVVGASNRLAVSAARAVAEAPGTVYNPLFIYSASGLGKTHLLAASGHATRALHPDSTIEYVTLEDLVDELHAAVAAGHADGFKRRFQGVTLLLLDDVQFLCGHAETQGEMLRLLNALQERGRQVIMASDRPPSEMADVDRRLLTRMSGGLIVDMGQPEYETRVAILRHNCAERGIEFGPGVLEELARAPSRSVRELQGLLNRLIAQSSLTSNPVTTDDARALVANSRTVSASPPDEFESFVSELATAVSESVEQWRVRLGEFVARWSGQGMRTAILERHLEAKDAPDLDSIEAEFGVLVNRLRSLESEAARLDPRLAGISVFRDPERVSEAETVVLRALATYDPPPAPDSTFTIDRFDAGARNQLALRAAGEAIALPGTRYNPLYVFGPTGAGKTHLAHAIGNALAAREASTFTVACVNAAAFTDELISALQDGSVERWRMRYRAADALIIDDVHKLSGKERTQDELFHLFNHFHAAGRQIVLTSDVPPPQLAEMASRLRTRFDGGLVVEMGRLSEAERVASHTPVPDGDEAAAPTIDAWFEEVVESNGAGPAAPVTTFDTDVDSFFLDGEKVIREWPALEGRIIEEIR